MGDVTITIPAEYAERFRFEAEWGVEQAAENLAEPLKWARVKRNPQSSIDEKRTIDPGRVAKERGRLEEAFRLLDQTRHSIELTVTADAATIASAVRGCLINVGDDAAGESQNIDTGPVEALADELKFWVELVVQHPEPSLVKREAA